MAVTQMRNVRLWTELVNARAILGMLVAERFVQVRVT